MNQDTRPYYNLDYLKDLTGNNTELIREFVQEGLLIANESSESLEKAFDRQDFLEIGRTCHMLKSSMKIFGSDYIESKLSLLEKEAQAKEDIQIRPLVVEVLALLSTWKQQVGSLL